MTTSLAFNPFDYTVDYNHIKTSYERTQRGYHKYRKEAMLFDMCRERNLVSLWRDLKSERYTVGQYARFCVYEPKERMVSAPRIRDKVVQFAAHEALSRLYDRVFIKTSFACQKERGTHKAVMNLQHDLRVCKWKYGGGWIVKMDVRKFFYSIDRDILKHILRKRVKDKQFLRLLDLIIDSSPEGDTGIPLGNVTSQDMANIYLNELDQFCVRYLHIKYYTRYMDDVVFIVPTREQARDYLERCKTFLREHLHLETNQKTKIFPLRQGVNAFGFKIFTTHRLLRNKSKQAMKRRIRAMDAKLKAGTIRQKDIAQAVNSWLGHARWSCSYNLCKKIFKPYQYIKVEGDNQFGRLSRHRQIRRSVPERGGTPVADKPVAK